MALTSQGLFYRTQDGDRFYFTMDVIDEGEVAETQIIYFEIDNASKPIPDPLTYLGDLDPVDLSIYYENGTNIGLLAIIFIYIPLLQFPVGNWSLINSLAFTDLEGLMIMSISNLSITYNADTLGFTYKMISTDTETTVWADYSIFDGVLSYYGFEYFNTTTDEQITKCDISRFSYHNLYWGFEDGDTFNFRIVMTGTSSGFQELDEELYIEVDEDGLPIIPYILDEWDDIPYIGGALYWANGTIAFEPFFERSWRIAVPLGNWSLLSALIEDKPSPSDLALDPAHPWLWGYSWSETTGDILLEVHTDYLKVDGFLARHSAVFTNATTSEVIGTITIERLDIETYTDDTAPSINHPDDGTFVEGTENNNITWIPTDDFPATYTISLNGSNLPSASWTSGSPIVLELDDFEVGEYNCTITVYDYAGNYVRDSVLVTVTAAPTTSSRGIVDLIMDNIIFVIIGVGVVVILGAGALLRRKS